MRNAIPTHATVIGSLKNYLSPSPIFAGGLCLLLVGVLIFREFFFSGAVLLYKDIGSDSINSYYPDFVHLSNYIRRHGFPSWSFHVGMGQDLSYATGYLIWQPVSWLPKDLIAHALVYQHLAKVLLAGLIFFRLLQLFRLSPPVPLLGSLLLSFSAYMCMGGCWYPFADEVVCFTAILLGTEEALRSGRWLILALAVMLVGMITPFHLYLSALLLVAYVPARLFIQNPKQPRAILRVCCALGAVATIGVGLGALVTVPYLYSVLNSPRGSGTTSAAATLSSFSFFALESPLHYVTAALRPFANDLLGAGDNFRGWQNYLEAPITYCGLLCLVVLPQAFVRAPRRHAIVFGLILAGILIPTIFPWLRYLFWLFQGDYYRTYSLFSVIAIITLAMIAFSNYREGRPLSLWLLAITALVLIATLYLPFKWWRTPVNPDLRNGVAVLLLAYSALLAAGHVLKRQKITTYFIVGLTGIELITFNRITVLDRKTVTKQELSERVGYNDETVDAVREINATDQAFFRITKLRPSTLSSFPSLNDAMVFGYYSTSSYSSFNSVTYTNFLTAVGAIRPSSETQTRWAMGLVDSALLSAFACEKYVLVDDPARFRTDLHYEPIRPYGRDFLFRNQLFLPLGVTYSRYMNEDLFLRLPNGEKQEALLRAVVLADGSAATRQGLSELTISELEEDMRTARLSDVVAARRETSLSLTSFDQTRIQGSVRLQSKGIMVVQTPFDPGWRALQDGKPVPVLQVDAGLLGVEVDKGEHNLDLHYRNPVLPAAAAGTLISFLLLGASLWRWPRLGLPV